RAVARPRERRQPRAGARRRSRQPSRSLSDAGRGGGRERARAGGSARRALLVAAPARREGRLVRARGVLAAETPARARGVRDHARLLAPERALQAAPQGGEGRRVLRPRGGPARARRSLEGGDERERDAGARARGAPARLPGERPGRGRAGDPHGPARRAARSRVCALNWGAEGLRSATVSGGTAEARRGT